MKAVIGLIIFYILNLLLLAILMPLLFTPKSNNDRARYDSALPKIAYIESVIEAYKLNTGKLPDKLEDLLYCPNGLEKIWQGPYLKKESQLYDPWGNPFVYEPNSAATDGYDLISYGKDGKPGGKKYKADIYNDYQEIKNEN